MTRSCGTTPEAARRTDQPDTEKREGPRLRNGGCGDVVQRRCPWRPSYRQRLKHDSGDIRPIGVVVQREELVCVPKVERLLRDKGAGAKSENGQCRCARMRSAGAGNRQKRLDAEWIEGTGRQAQGIQHPEELARRA